ncbi:collagen-like protein [Enterococcus sp. FDAARGOS_375]|uniref:collagen-like protein n=1 Tax=Enterococcus sp. FDAARGOS_375 TaxID=2060307 RepID=UPI000BBD0FC0|nr:collagen-like protein [Enterococcus sp. FDAARGOS_375]ATF71619.1 hypothetical protein CO692_05625 [Enterococcus sp. FDAARGOS_375]
MPVVQDEISLVKVANGDDGRGILGTPVATYAQSTSGTIPPTSWSATRPNVPAGQYLWTRVVTTYTDNTTSETQTPTLMGAEGESGLGIKDKSISYAAGTSGNTPPTSGWQETIPTVSSNQYLWTKTTLIYTDESKTEAYSVGKMGADGANAKLLYLTASAENMAFNADDTPKTTQTINISAKLQNVTGTATFAAIPYIGNTAQTAITLGGTGNTRTLTSAQWTNKDWTLIAITATLDNLSDTLSIVKVKDGKEGETYFPHPAWMMVDGTFTKVYPNENLIDARVVIPSSNNSNLYPITNETRSDNGKQFSRTRRTNPTQYPTTFSIFTSIDVRAIAPALTGKRIGLSNYVRGSTAVNMSLMARYVGTNESGTFPNESVGVKIGTSWQKVSFIVESFPADVSTIRFNPLQIATPVPDLSQFFLDMRDWKIEILDNDQEPTYFTTPPSVDYENAYPKYEGFYSDTNEAGSDNPDDYKPWTPFMGPQGPAGEDGKDGSDGKDGANGQDAKEVISGYLSNDSIIVPANASGTVTDFTKALGDFIIYEGQTKVSSGVTYSKVSETGMTSTINSAGRYTVTALSADVGTVTYQAVYKAVTIQKIMIVVKNKQGATGPAGSNGTDGKGIVSSATTYQAGTSGTTPPTGTWSTSIPSVSENQYLWTKIVLTYSDNTNSAAYSVGKMGAKGEAGATGSTGATGATGNGIKSTTINFASSTSGTTAPSSGWSTSIPTVAAGSFLWTRTVLTFTDNTTNTSYTVAKQGEKGDPTGIISQSKVPTNPYVGMLWQNTGASGYIIGATYQWNGSKFNLYIFTADNIVATTLSAITANLGNITAGNISGVTISGSKFINEFSYQPYPTNSSIFVFGTTTIENGRWNTEYRQEGNKGIGIVDHTGTAILDPTGVQFSQTMVASNGENSFAKFNALELTMNYGGRGGTLTYNDLYSLPKTGIPSASGWSQYNTSESSENFPSATRQGRMVQLSGAFKNNAVKAAGTENDVMGTLPLGYRPTADCNFICQGTGSNIYLLTVKSNGQLTFSRYRGDTGASNNYRFDYKECGANSWLNIACTFAAADV